MFKKTLRTIKTGIIFGAFLFSLSIIFFPTASAGLINISPIINITYPIQNEPLIPNSGVLDIPLHTTFKLTGPFASIVEGSSLLRKTGMQIELKVLETPDWCSASISNPLAQLALNQEEPYQSTLTVTVTEKAPAFTQGVIRIIATSKVQRGLLFNIIEETVEFDVSFIVGYWSAVSYELPNGTIAEIEPFDTADFIIDIQNLGNGPTYIEIEIKDISDEEWDIDIPSSVQLSSAVYDGESAKETFNLKIKPKKISDWNNERKIFKVKFFPSYLGRPDLTGQPETITFNVQKIGSLDEEEESDYNLLVILVAAVIVIIHLSIFLKRRHLK
ncbi:MAG: hypothetical protein AYK22_05690 [Thermoplasmatales archaeon SG8-52-3]|nr:MAG: hypothetical protein AYK22_05690 [Thermoplasmatales archaeon SG8-52-3]